MQKWEITMKWAYKEGGEKEWEGKNEQSLGCRSAMMESVIFMLVLKLNEK